MTYLVKKKTFYYDLLYLPLIGEFIEITNSKNILDIGKKGFIIRETYAFFYLNIDGEIKKFYKKNICFKILKKQQALNIDASFLFSTLQTRLKKVK